MPGLPLYIKSPFLESEIARLQAEEAHDAALQEQLLLDGDRGNLVLKDEMPSPPWYSTTNGLLAGLVFGGNAVGYENLQVGATTAVGLASIPSKAKIATIQVEADATTVTKEKALRFLELGTDLLPTASRGFFVADTAQFDVRGLKNLKRFRIIGRESGKTHTLQITYYA